MHIKYLKMIIRKITSLIVALKHEPVGDCLDLGVINVLPTDQKKKMVVPIKLMISQVT